MDYKKFLSKKEELVLPYLGGAFVHARDRRLRVEDPWPAIGYHRFEVSGRNARSLGAAEAPSFEGLPKARGHFVGGFVCHASRIDRLALPPSEEIMPLALVRARQWPSSDWLYESIDFDTEVEEAARAKLEERVALGDLKGVPSTLRSAFGIALALEIAARAQIPYSVLEAAPHAAVIAEGGPTVVEQLFETITRERRAALERAERAARDHAERERIRALMEHREAARNARRERAATADNARERSEEALEGTGATMISGRRVDDERFVVTFEFMGTRFISTVDIISLQVLDAGICLDGEDELVTLDSLPGVIREAIDTHRLVVTRR